MKFISITLLKGGALEKVYVYQDHYIADAETKFNELIKDIDNKISDEDIYLYLENGYYVNSENKIEIYFTWSNNSTNNIRQSRIDYIIKVITEFGPISSKMLELESSPCIECTNDMSILIERFYPEKCEADIYIGNDEIISIMYTYKTLSDDILNEIYNIIKDYDAKQLQEKN